MFWKKKIVYTPTERESILQRKLDIAVEGLERILNSSSVSFPFKKLPVSGEGRLAQWYLNKIKQASDEA